MSLNLASNNLGAEGAKVIAEAIKVTQCVCDYFGIIFVSISLNWLFAIIHRIWGR